MLKEEIKYETLYKAKRLFVLFENIIIDYISNNGRSNPSKVILDVKNALEISSKTFEIIIITKQKKE